MVSAVVFTYCSIYGGPLSTKRDTCTCTFYRYVAKWQKHAFIDKTSDRKVIDDRPNVFTPSVIGLDLYRYGQLSRAVSLGME